MARGRLSPVGATERFASRGALEQRNSRSAKRESWPTERVFWLLLISPECRRLRIISEGYATAVKKKHQRKALFGLKPKKRVAS